MQLTPADARMYWLAGRIRSDQFLLYCFDTSANDDAALRDAIRGRVERIGDLRSAVRDVPGHLDHPYWVPRAWSDDLVVVHRLRDRSWPGLQEALGSVVGTPLDARESTWRLHCYPRVQGAPGCRGDALVVVLQVSHAFADGRRASALARELFSPVVPDVSPPPPEPPPASLATVRAVLRFPGRFRETIRAGRRAAHVNRILDEAVSSGEVPPAATGFALSAVNVPPGPVREVRSVVRPARMFRAGGVTVTVAALTVVSVALPRLLASLGGTAPARLGAEVTIAVDAAGARNGYRNAGVDLFVTEPDLRVRADRIAVELAARRARLSHLLSARRDEVDDHVPAPLAKFGVDRSDLDVVPATVTGNTVVTSVARGRGDLELLGGPAVFSSGFPGLSPVMGLTHGVYGLGDAVSIGICASPRAVPDVDAYASMLGDALDEVASALGSASA